MNLYQIDWKKLTEGLDEETLLYIEGCVRGATIDYEAALKATEPWFIDTPEEQAEAQQCVDAVLDAAVGEETP